MGGHAVPTGRGAAPGAAHGTGEAAAALQLGAARPDAHLPQAGERGVDGLCQSRSSFVYA